MWVIQYNVLVQLSNCHLGYFLFVSCFILILLVILICSFCNLLVNMFYCIMYVFVRSYIVTIPSTCLHNKSLYLQHKPTCSSYSIIPVAVAPPTYYIGGPTGIVCCLMTSVQQLLNCSTSLAKSSACAFHPVECRLPCTSWVHSAKCRLPSTLWTHPTICRLPYASCSSCEFT